MAITQKAPGLLIELSEFLASAPSQEQLMQYRPSKQLQERASELLAKLKSDPLTAEEEQELDDFQCINTLMGLVKARIRANQATRS